MLGIDIFLGTSIATVTLDEYFPDALAFVLDMGAFVGFAQLLIGPAYLGGLQTNLQFYYCMGYAAISVLSSLGSNLYLYFMKREYILSGVFAIAVSAPAFLATFYFASMYANGIPVALPLLPTLSWIWVYIAFSATAITIVCAMVLTALKKDGGGVRHRPPSRPRAQ